jgi:transcriptional regulator with XRE-family HTH domain
MSLQTLRVAAGLSRHELALRSGVGAFRIFEAEHAYKALSQAEQEKVDAALATPLAATVKAIAAFRERVGA